MTRAVSLPRDAQAPFHRVQTRITADIGAEVPVDCVALISTTLGAGAMVLARLSNVANFSVTLADTGLLNAEA
jgi:hypothetical protein